MALCMLGTSQADGHQGVVERGEQVQSGVRRTQARHLKVEDLFEEGEDGDDEVSLWIPLWVERMEIQLPGLRGSETERAKKGGRTGEGKEVKGDEERNTYRSCRRPRIGHECDTTYTSCRRPRIGHECDTTYTSCRRPRIGHECDTTYTSCRRPRVGHECDTTYTSCRRPRIGHECDTTYTSCRRPRVGHECDTRAEGTRVGKKVQSGAGGGAGREGKGRRKERGEAWQGEGSGGRHLGRRESCT
jgi:hypothetical protein